MKIRSVITIISLWLCKEALWANAHQAPLATATIDATEPGLQKLTIDSLNENFFEKFSHRRYPGHSLRVKKSRLCDPTVNVYTGYLDVDYGAKHLFFYFFESRRSPENDDVMMWVNGGPGGSSEIGLLMTMGPCNIDMANVSTNGTTWNPHSWNNEANIFFLDQPVGVGFSYADYGETIETTEDAAKNVAAFINIFFDTFSQFKNRPLHLAGESYGGHYLPVFASEIVDQNIAAKMEGRDTINLKSIIIGNGETDISTEYPGRFEVQCGKSAFDIPPRGISECVVMRQALPRCQAAIKKYCTDLFDAMNCRASIQFCDDNIPFLVGSNPFDLSKECFGGVTCYLEAEAIESYMNSNSVRENLGLTQDVFPRNFSVVSMDVNQAFEKRMDLWSLPTQFYVAELLERGVRVLIYVGTFDSVCGWTSNRLWVEKLQWSGLNNFLAQPWTTWRVDGREVGDVKSTSLLSLASVWGAGHMAPHDKPLEALSLIKRWLAKDAI
ncbi:alpha/beta-hydrolase [Schizopora paradoxa]|uniref:Carboxypeptidase n=1 Tax=Schizopora paradoxa TaxID=27342 RepID=A0A0H2SF96_9AGAM|nr:alpha/beta-hydrolase [Schizopora paradoxa]